MHVCWRACSDHSKEVYKVAFIITGCVYLLVVVPLEIWFFTVVLACYRYLRDKLVAAALLPSAYAKQTNPVRF
jgi:hypothetical protein